MAVHLHQKLFARKLKIFKKQASLLWYPWGAWQHLVVIGFLQLPTISWQIKIRLQVQSGFLHYSQPLKIQSKKWEWSTDGVATTDLAETSALSPLGKNTQDIYQLSIENGYDRFLDVVSRGRQLSKDKVDKIAQGQVWLGQDAQKNGLVDELGDIDIAIDKVVALVNQHPDKYMDNFSVQWLVDEDNSFLAKLDRKLKQKGQALLTNWLGLPQEVHQVKKQLNALTKFNDPKGQYLYCLNCGSVK